MEVASGTDGDNPDVPNLTTDSSWDPDGGIINLSNSQDQVLLRDASQVEIDRIAWGPSSSQLDPDAEADGQSWFRKNLLSDTDTSDDWELTPLDQLSTPGKGSTVTGVAPPTFAARWETDDNNERVLVWNDVPGTLFYEIRSSTDLREWQSVETVLTTPWIPPQDLEGPVFYAILRDHRQVAHAMNTSTLIIICGLFLSSLSWVESGRAASRSLLRMTPPAAA